MVMNRFEETAAIADLRSRLALLQAALGTKDPVATAKEVRKLKLAVEALAAQVALLTAAVGMSAPAIQETGTGTDSVSVHIRVHKPVADAGSGSESMRVKIRQNEPLADAGSGSDSMHVKIRVQKALTEHGTGHDAVSSVAAQQSSDSATASETSGVQAM